jgi:hypothetical protein
MTQTIEYVVKVNAAQAQAAIADVEKRFGGVDTVVARLDKNLISLERDIKDLNAAIAAGGPNVEHYKRQLEGLQAAAGGAVGKGGGHGHGMLQLSQTLDDLQYGIKGIVNNIPGLVQGFGMGAGIAGAAQLAFIAVNQLTDKLTGYIKKQQEATQAAIKFRNSMLDVQIGAMQETADLQKRLGELNTEIGGGMAATAKAEADRQLKEIDERISNLDQQQSKRRGTVEALERIQFKSGEQEKQIAYEKAQIKNILTRMDTERSLKDEVRKQLEIKEKILKAEEKLANMGRKGPAETRDYSLSAEDQAMYGAGFKGPSLMAAILESTADLNEEQAKQDAEIRDIFTTAESNMIDWVGKMREEAQDHRAKNELKAYDERRKLAEKEKKEQEKDAAEMQKKWDDFYMGFAELGAQGFGMVASAGQQYFDDIITGQEHAAEMMAISLMRTAGDALVGHGVNLLGASVVSLLTPGLQPLAAAQAGAGAGLVAAGMGLGAGATAASHVLAGGTIGQKLPDDKSGTRDKGASPRSSGGGGGGGPLIVNVAYGAGGPLPEDIAREIYKVTSSGNRRRGAA